MKKTLNAQNFHFYSTVDPICDYTETETETV